MPSNHLCMFCRPRSITSGHEDTTSMPSQWTRCGAQPWGWVSGIQPVQCLDEGLAAGFGDGHLGTGHNPMPVGREGGGGGSGLIAQALCTSARAHGAHPPHPCFSSSAEVPGGSGQRKQPPKSPAPSRLAEPKPNPSTDWRHYKSS